MSLRLPAGLAALAALAVACGGEPDGSVTEDADVPPLDRSGVPDAARDAPFDVAIDTPSGIPRDVATDRVLDATTDVPTDASAPSSGVAPSGAVAGELSARDGANPARVPQGGETVFRVDAAPGEHVAFVLEFAPTSAPVVMQVDRWDGRRPVELGRTDAGPGLRTLAVLDQGPPRTFWARVRTTGAAPTSATLRVTRTPFQEGSRCASDCARLLQLPLPNDARVDGYAHASTTVFRYQFGRRDLLMFVRHAARTMARAGRAPVVPEDLSQWDGMTPGTDVGRLRHSSHQRGKDVDISLYGLDGLAPWRSYCTVAVTSEGRECRPSTVANYDGVLNAVMFSQIFATERVTMCFLDRELITVTRAGASAAARMGTLAAGTLPLFSDGQHLQHWPNHDNHIHVRVTEAVDGALTYEPFEAP
jgi:hypothetical protein